MTEWLARVFAGRPWFEILRDVCDVLAVAFVIYRALLVIRGTRAMQMGVGLLFILLVYLGAHFFHLGTLEHLLDDYLLKSIVLIVVVVFQNDIRRALIRVGGQAWFGRGGKQEQSRVIDEVVAAVTELARHRIGAIIAFEQDANLLEFTKSEGTVVGAAVTRELLVALFYPESVNKLHDGAVLIRDLKIARAGVFFPMPDTKVLDKSLGSRHRAALGITEETDAVVVVVSEERGIISFCFNGNIVPNLDGTALRQTLIGLLGQKQKPPARLPSRAPTTRADAPKALKDPLAQPPSERPSIHPPRSPGRATMASNPHGFSAPQREGSVHEIHPERTPVVEDIHDTRPSMGTSRRMPRSTVSPSMTPPPLLAKESRGDASETKSPPPVGPSHTEPSDRTGSSPPSERTARPPPAELKDPKDPSPTTPAAESASEDVPTESARSFVPKVSSSAATPASGIEPHTPGDARRGEEP